MKSNTKNQVIEIINKNGRMRPSELSQALNISPQMLHRHLKTLIAEGTIQKLGVPPLTFYELKKTDSPQHSFKSETIQQFLDSQFSWLTATGRLIDGSKGFILWCQSTSQMKAIDSLANAYIDVRSKFQPRNGLVSAIEKFRGTFNNCALDEVYYSDFWALPQFGRTRLAFLLTLGKSGQSKQAISNIAEEIRPALKAIIQDLKIDSVVFVPHSIPRKVQFLEHLAINLRLDLPSIRIKKIFATGTPIAQKSLAKLNDRIENARTSIFLVDRDKPIAASRVLIIDDAVGSGATLNVVAEQLKHAGVKWVVGYAVVGSLKGFDVINEI
jgi:phosphoribosylpyrophosphate synthetase